jgi:hypothetical protein
MEKKKTHKKDEGVELVRMCNQYCQILEKADKVPAHELLDKISEALMAVYHKTYAIPRFQTRYESEAQKFLTEKQYNKVRATLMGILEKRDLYTEVLDPNRPASQNIFQASLSEDLTDIYQDFYDLIQWYSQGTLESVNDSLIECLNNFEKFWGVKLLNALRAIHVMRYLKKDATLFRDPLVDEEEELPVASGEDDDDDSDDPEEAIEEFLKEDI